MVISNASSNISHFNVKKNRKEVNYHNLLLIYFTINIEILIHQCGIWRYIIQINKNH